MDVMPETLRCTNLGLLRKGSSVNLERAMKADSRFGGHIVTGHIDEVGTIKARRPEGKAIWLGIKAPEREGIAPKGSIAIDGVSLTISKIESDLIWVSLVPHTLGETNLSGRRVGDKCNIEYDILSKYCNALQHSKADTIMTTLRENGF